MTSYDIAILLIVGAVGVLSFAAMLGFKVKLSRRMNRAVFWAMALVCVLCYSGKNSSTNDASGGAGGPRLMSARPAPVEVDSDDVARLFKVVSIGTGETFDFSMPSNAVREERWWRRGGCHDLTLVPGGVVMIGGEILDSLRNPTNCYYPLKSTIGMVPHSSVFWYGETASNTFVYTWQDALLWRESSLPFSMQAELFGDGEFEYRYDFSRISDDGALSNAVVGARFGTNALGDVSTLLGGSGEVSSVRFRCLSGFDWDGDGLANDIDPEPYVANGDCHGQGAGWVDACFTNAAEIAAAGGYANWIAATIAADVDNQWYSFTITVDEFDATGRSCVTLDGKPGPTNDATDILYCDTSIVGETNRQCATVYFHPDPVEAPHVVLSSPNTIFVNDDDDNGNGTNDFVDATCPFAVEDDDIAEISAGFESFGCMTNGTLRLAAEGARIWDNRRHIGTPVASVTMTNCVTPFRRSFYIERDSLAYSTVDGVKLSLEWLERENDALGVVTNRLTAVEPIVEPICSEMVATDGTRFVVNPALVIPGGPKASFKFTIFPTDYPQSEILWCCDNTDISFWGGNTGTNVLLVASDNMVFDGQTESRLSINIGNAPSAAPFFCFVVAHSKVIKLHTRILSSSFTYKTPISAEELKQLNGVFTQIGIKFVIENHGAIKRDELSVYDANAPASALLMEELTENDDGISVFFVDKIDNAVAFTEPICGMVFVQRNCDWMVLAHELGHSLGADDIYWTSAHRWPDDPVSKVVGPFNASVVDADVDWNNGTGQRFYNNGFAHKELIERILMYGVMGYNGVDIPHSSVFGVASGGVNGAKFENRYTRVGRDAMNGEGGL